MIHGEGSPVVPMHLAHITMDGLGAIPATPVSHVALNGHCLTFLDEQAAQVHQELYVGQPVTEAHLLAWAMYRALEKKLPVHPEVLNRTDRVLSQAAGIRTVSDLALEVRAHEDAS
jgi:hypothetical protein